jgi:hypothetical protein
MNSRGQVLALTVDDHDILRAESPSQSDILLRLEVVGFGLRVGSLRKEPVSVRAIGKQSLNYNAQFLTLRRNVIEDRRALDNGI